jgi:predicted alpha/beta superfamily hydrolase
VGDLRVLQQGELDRDLWVWLPPGHDEGDRRYPAVYLHDAQQLFDEGLAGGPDWRLDETLNALAESGLPLIAAALPHAGILRREEYMGRGLEQHVRRLLAAKEIVDGDFRTSDLAAVGGSSAGANASVYAWARYPRLFRRVLAMSPGFFADRERLFAAVAEVELRDVRIWLDVGTDEGDTTERREAFLGAHRDMTALLRERGLGEDRLRSLVVEGGRHDEAAWAERLPDALRFLFG